MHELNGKVKQDTADKRPITVQQDKKAKFIIIIIRTFGVQ